MFIQNLTLCKHARFGNIGKIITYPSDILTEKNNALFFLTELEFEKKYGIWPNVDLFISLKLVITPAIQRLRTSLDRIRFNLPAQPPLVQLIN